MTETVPSALAAAMSAVRSAPDAAGALPAGAEPAVVSAGALAAVLGALDAPGLEQAATTRAKIANGVTDRSRECLVIKVGSPLDGESMDSGPADSGAIRLLLLWRSRGLSAAAGDVPPDRRSGRGHFTSRGTVRQECDGHINDLSAIRARPAASAAQTCVGWSAPSLTHVRVPRSGSPMNPVGRRKPAGRHSPFDPQPRCGREATAARPSISPRWHPATSWPRRHRSCRLGRCNRRRCSGRRLSTGTSR